MTQSGHSRLDLENGFMMRFQSCLLVPIIVGGCAHNIEFVDLDYEFLDEPSENRIGLTLQNLSENPLCMSLESWPNDKGEVGMPGEYFTLVVGDRQFPVALTHFDFCPSCVYFVLPGETVTAHVAYSSFGLPDSLAHEEKVLSFQPAGYMCKVPPTCAPDDKIDIGTWTGSKVEACDD